VSRIGIRSRKGEDDLPDSEPPRPEGRRLATPDGKRIFLMEAELPEEARASFSGKLMAGRPDLDPFPTARGVGLILLARPGADESDPQGLTIRFVTDELMALRRPGFPFPRLRMAWLRRGMPPGFLVGEKPFLLGPLKVNPIGCCPSTAAIPASDGLTASGGDPGPGNLSPEIGGPATDGNSVADSAQITGGFSAGTNAPVADSHSPDGNAAGNTGTEPETAPGALPGAPDESGGPPRARRRRRAREGPSVALPPSLVLSPRRRLEISLAASLMADWLSPPPGAPDTRGLPCLVCSEGPAVLPLAALKLGSGPVTFLCAGEEASHSAAELAAGNGEEGRIETLSAPLARSLKPNGMLSGRRFGIVCLAIPPTAAARLLAALASLLEPSGRIILAGPELGHQTATLHKAAFKAGLSLCYSIIRDDTAALSLELPRPRRAVPWDWKPGDWSVQLTEDDLAILAQLEGADAPIPGETDGYAASDSATDGAAPDGEAGKPRATVSEDADGKRGGNGEADGTIGEPLPVAERPGQDGPSPETAGGSARPRGRRRALAVAGDADGNEAPPKPPARRRGRRPKAAVAELPVSGPEPPIGGDVGADHPDGGDAEAESGSDAGAESIIGSDPDDSSRTPA
jgi:hypothetical protein